MVTGKKISTALFFAALSSSALSAQNEISFRFQNDEFILKKECLSGISPGETNTPDIHLLRLSLVNNDHCAKKLNSLINKNIGTMMLTSFNGKVINESHISGPLKTESGFRTTLEKSDLMASILSSYQ